MIISGASQTKSDKQENIFLLRTTYIKTQGP